MHDTLLDEFAAALIRDRPYLGLPVPIAVRFVLQMPAVWDVAAVIAFERSAPRWEVWLPVSALVRHGTGLKVCDFAGTPEFLSRSDQDAASLRAALCILARRAVKAYEAVKPSPADVALVML